MSNYEYHQFLKFLYFEGYADSYEEAEYLLEELSDEEFEELQEKYVRALDTTGRGPDHRAHTTDPTVRPIRKRRTPEKYKHSEAEFDPRLTSPSARGRKTERRQGVGGRSYAEAYEVIVDYLFNEGYAETPEGAEVMAENISEDWINEILESSDSKWEEIRRSTSRRRVSSATPIRVGRTPILSPSDVQQSDPEVTARRKKRGKLTFEVR